MDLTAKIAILGLGKWGKNLIKEFSKQATIAYCFHNGNTENSTWLKQNYPNIQITDSYEKILADKSVGAIVIATPIATHYELAMQALKAGKNIFIEKPGTETSVEMQALCEEAKENNLTIAVGYLFIQSPAFLKLKELIKNEKIESLNFEWLKWGTFLEHPTLNLFSHEISIMLSLGLIPDKKEFYQETKLVSDADILQIILKSGETKITAYLNRVSSEKRKTVICKTNKNIYIWENDSLFIVDPTKKEKLEIGIDKSKTPLALEVSDFLKCLEGGGKPKADGELAVQILKIIEL